MDLCKVKEELVASLAELKPYMIWFLEQHNKNMYSKAIGKGAKEIFSVERKELADKIRLYRKLNQEFVQVEHEDEVFKI